jgi:hypothetical protein
MYTTDCNYFRITNYNNVQEGYYKWIGCTDIVSVTSIDPLNTQYLCAKNVIVEGYSAPLNISFVGLCPSSTPTPTVTPTVTPSSVTPTPTASSPTPTPTTTPSITPTTIYQYNLRTGGWYQNVCQGVNMISNPANVTIFTSKPFTSLEPGDYVYGDQNLSIPPVNANYTISDGARFIQLSGNLIINVGVC